MKNADWLARYRAGGRLPSPRGVYLEALRLLEQEEVDNRELARVLQSDPATNAKLLQLANASARARSRPVVSVSDAIFILGQVQIKRLVLALALIQSSAARVDGFPYRLFWSQSLLTALAVQAVAERLGRVNADEIFVVALLAHIGRLALASLFPESYTALLASCAEKSEQECRQQERNLFEIDQDELSALLLEDWGLPGIFVEVVLHQSYPEGLLGTPQATRSIFLIHLLRLGQAMAGVCLQNNPQWQDDARKLRQEMNYLGLSREAIDEELRRLLAAWPRWRELLQEAETVRSAVTGWEENGATVEPAPPSALQVACIGEGLGDQIGACAALFAKLGIVPQMLARNVDPLQLNSSDWDLLILARDPAQPAVDEGILNGLDPILGPYLLLLGRDPLSAEEESRLFRFAVDAYEILPLSAERLQKHLHLAERRREGRRNYAIGQQRMQLLADSLVEKNRNLRQVAWTDPLTELRNRRYAEERLAQEWAICESRNSELGLMLLDLDHFKEINDTEGHEAGDRVLRRVARILEELLREQDIPCRLGGDEFLIICSETGPSGMQALANRICNRLAEPEAWRELPGPISVSIGIASRQPGMQGPDELIAAADRALFEAKRSGRGRVAGQV
ncbi:MAG: GGDEF domain-containing protein [Acidithiobacillus sp.]|nr:GGDEF domain-containing protein [Acidithiobacillus sp.]